MVNQNDDFLDFDWDEPKKPKPAPTRIQTNLSTIQMLRGFAALAVLIAHLHAVEAKLGGEILFGNWALVGFGGVDLFFVISGFVMVWVTGYTHTDTRQIGRFWAHRLFRIYPLWWLVLGAIFAVYLVRPDWVYQSHASNPNVLKSFLLIPDKDLPLHAVGWTLIHELWFYFVFGIFLFFPKRILPILLLVWAISIGASLFLNYSPIDPWLKLIRHPLTLEFIVGAFIGILARAKILPFPKTILIASIFGILISAFSTSAIAQDFFANEYKRVFFFGIPSALLIWALVGLEENGHRAPKPFCALGDWSYALYLVHVPVFAAIGRLARPFSRDGLIDNIAITSIALFAAIFAAFILHQFFEKPILRITKQRI